MQPGTVRSPAKLGLPPPAREVIDRQDDGCGQDDDESRKILDGNAHIFRLSKEPIGIESLIDPNPDLPPPGIEPGGPTPGIERLQPAVHSLRTTATSHYR